VRVRVRVRVRFLGQGRLQVIQPDRLVHDLLVHNVREAHVEDHAVVDGDAEEDPDELKLAVTLERVLMGPEGGWARA